MALLEIRDAVIYKSADAPFVGWVDAPAIGQVENTWTFTFTGWVLGKREKVVSISLMSGEKKIKDVSVEGHRPGVVLQFPHYPGNLKSGFYTSVSVLGLKNPCRIDVLANFESGGTVVIGHLDVAYQSLTPEYQPEIQPLMVTSLGRSGSTWSMRLLGEHPDICIYNAYPYETMAASFWAHSIKVLTDPANHVQSSRRHGFEDGPWMIGNNPYFSRPESGHPVMNDWFGSELIARTAGHFMQNIDQFYGKVAQTQGDRSPKYFAEKNRVNHIPRIFELIYENAKEVIVIRDFRDMVCSMFAFNARVGYTRVGPLGVSSDEEFVRMLRPRITRLLDAADERRSTSLVIMYEDLIRKPEQTLSAIYAYLGLDHQPELVREALDRANERPDLKARLKDTAKQVLRKDAPKTESLQSHVTSGGGASQSIDRWKRDLSPQLQDVAHDSWGDLLERAGYEVP